MFFKRLLCLILFSKQIFPLLCEVIPPVIGDNNSFINDPDSLSMFAKYEEWNPRVRNGWAAKLGDVPYQVSLKMLVKRANSLYRNVCGAVIIGPRKLLSAAHCFRERRKFSNCNKIWHPGKVSSRRLDEIHVVAGSLNNMAQYKSDGQWRRLAYAEFPKTYSFPKDDIAVAILKHPFNYNHHVGPIPIATVDKKYEGKCLTSGYGRTEGNQRSEVLLLAHLTVLPDEICVRKKNDFNVVYTSINSTDVAMGDSGGPLVCAQTGDPNEGPKGQRSEVLLLAHLIVLTDEKCYHKKNAKFVFTSVSLTDVGKGDSGGPLVCAQTGDPNEGPKGQRSEVLLLAHLIVLTDEKCYHKKNAKFVFTSVSLTDVGKGDSGGPLVCAQTGDPNEGPKGVLVGITSASRTGFFVFAVAASGKIKSMKIFEARHKTLFNLSGKIVNGL
ncbi:hypothetical protein PYW08_003328 [Mythimna loreyi]|uniref:Uncharacterized protein n=1 Tax=Mythimna loreyi TaxID=667449 RepID=A0ACC2QT36_9NEOP|nr:hypothetical protein PYW08_003328 [Mythimna loreyi]